MLRNMARVSKMNSKEVLNFLSPNRKWIKDDLFSRDEDFLSYDFGINILFSWNERHSDLFSNMSRSKFSDAERSFVGCHGSNSDARRAYEH